MKNKTESIFLLFIAMLSVVVMLVCTFLFLNKINVSIQIVLVILLILALCWLMAKFAVELLSLSKAKSVNAKNQDDIVCRDTEILSQLQLRDMLVKNDFSIAHSSKEEDTNILNGLLFLRKVVRNRGSYTTDVFVIQTIPSESEWVVLDREIHKLISNSEKMSGLKMIMQRNIILFVFADNINDDTMRRYISQFDYDFSLILPVLVDTKNAKIYHWKIPVDKRFAKGKALVSLQQFISFAMYV